MPTLNLLIALFFATPSSSTASSPNNDSVVINRFFGTHPENVQMQINVKVCLERHCVEPSRVTTLGYFDGAALRREKVTRIIEGHVSGRQLILIVSGEEEVTRTFPLNARYVLDPDTLEAVNAFFNEHEQSAEDNTPPVEVLMPPSKQPKPWMRFRLLLGYGWRLIDFGFGSQDPRMPSFSSTSALGPILSLHLAPLAFITNNPLAGIDLYTEYAQVLGLRAQSNAVAFDTTVYEINAGLQLHFRPQRESNTSIGPLAAFQLVKFAIGDAGTSGAPNLTMDNLLLGIIFEMALGEKLFCNFTAAFALNLGIDGGVNDTWSQGHSGWGFDINLGLGDHLLPWLIFQAGLTIERYNFVFSADNPTPTGVLTSDSTLLFIGLTFGLGFDL